MAAAEMTNRYPTPTPAQFEAAEREDDGITLMDLFHIIGKHAVSAAISCVAVFFAVCAYTLVTPPQYSATAQVFATYSDASVRDDDISSINSASTYIANTVPAPTSPTRSGRIRRWPPPKPCCSRSSTIWDCR